MCGTQCLNYLKNTKTLTISRSIEEDAEFLFRIVSPQSYTYCWKDVDVDHFKVTDGYLAGGYGRFCIAQLVEGSMSVYISTETEVGYINKDTILFWGQEPEEINVKEEEKKNEDTTYDYRYVSTKFDVTFDCGVATVCFTKCISKEYKALVIAYVIGLAMEEHRDYMIENCPLQQSYHNLECLYQPELDSLSSYQDPIGESSTDLYLDKIRLSLVAIGKNWAEKAIYLALVDRAGLSFSKPQICFIKYSATQNQLELISANSRRQLLVANLETMKCCVYDANRQIGFLGCTGKSNIWSVVGCHGEMKEMFKSLRVSEQSRKVRCLDMNENIIGKYEICSHPTLELSSMRSSLKRLVLVDFIRTSLHFFTTQMPLIQHLDKYELVTTKRHNDPLKTLQILQTAEQLILWEIGHDKKTCRNYYIVLDGKTGHNYFLIECQLERRVVKSAVVKNFRGREIVSFEPLGCYDRIDIFSGAKRTSIGHRTTKGCYEITDGFRFLTERNIAKPSCPPSIDLMDNQMTCKSVVANISGTGNETICNLYHRKDVEKQSRIYFAFILAAMVNAQINILYIRKTQVLRQISMGSD